MSKTSLGVVYYLIPEFLDIIKNTTVNHPPPPLLQTLKSGVQTLNYILKNCSYSGQNLCTRSYFDILYKSTLILTKISENQIVVVLFTNERNSATLNTIYDKKTVGLEILGLNFMYEIF